MPKDMYRKPPISPQAFKVLRLLASSKRPMRAHQIAHELDILPNAANRSIAQLMSYGLIEGGTHFSDRVQPLYYRCQTLNLTKRRYLERMEQEFDEWFSPIVEDSHSNRFYRKD